MNRIIVEVVPDFRLSLDPDTQMQHAMLDLQYLLASEPYLTPEERAELETRMEAMTEKRQEYFRLEAAHP